MFTRIGSAVTARVSLARAYSKAMKAVDTTPIVAIAEKDAQKSVSKRQVRRQRMTKLASNKSPLGAAADLASTAKYVAADKMPQVPQDVQTRTPEDLYRQIYKEEPPKNYYVDFSIPIQHSKTYQKAQLTDKDTAILNGLDLYMKETDETKFPQHEMDLTRLYYDRDSFALDILPEHYLRKSLSGMINLNPALDDIDDDYLWEVLPEEKMFGKPPYEQYKPNEPVDINKFKKWEHKKIREREEMKDKTKIIERRFSELLKAYGNPSSFYSKENGRYKLNRELLLKYKRLKSEAVVMENSDPENQNTLKKASSSAYKNFELGLDNDSNETVEIEIKALKKIKN